MDIFLVEDDEIYAEFIKKSLSSKPEYKVKVFKSAEDAFANLNGTLPEVMIIDYKLPGMNGVELFEKIQGRISDNQKVILLSAIDDGNMVLSFIKRGIRDYVIKDDAVIDSIKAILEGKEDDFYLFN